MLVGCVLILVQLANTCQHYWNILGFPHQSAIVSWLDSFIMGPKQYICICIFACIECFALWKACRGWKTQCRNGWPTIETFWGNTWHGRTKPRLGRIILWDKQFWPCVQSEPESSLTLFTNTAMKLYPNMCSWLVVSSFTFWWSSKWQPPEKGMKKPCS